jgi:prevent-host-death family protein
MQQRAGRKAAGMTQMTVGVRELKSRLSHYLQQVAAGHTVIITDRGEPVGQIVPVHAPAESRVQQLVAAGMAAWSGRKPSATTSPVTNPSDTSIADLLLEDRE